MTGESELYEPATGSLEVGRHVKFKSSNGYAVTYGDILDAIMDTDSDPFHMEVKDDAEWVAIAQCVNQGIDGRLEAITNAREEFDNGTCEVTPSNMCVLLRRLSEGPYVADKRLDDEVWDKSLDEPELFNKYIETTEDLLWDAAGRIQSDILMVLGFDESCKYVGREALGL